MSRAQGLTLLALGLIFLVNISTNPAALALWKGGHPIQGTQAVSPLFLVYAVVVVVVLVVLADVSPLISGWITALLLVGTVLTKGDQLTALLGGKSK
jgi:hypothetical protein